MSSFVLWYHEQTMYSSITASSYPLLSLCSSEGGGSGGLLSLIKKSLFCTARLDITSSSSSRRPRRRFCGGTSLPTSVLSTEVLKHELRPAEEKSRDLVEGKKSFIGTKQDIEKIAAGLNEPTYYLSNEELLVHPLRANQIQRLIAVTATSSSSLTAVVPLPISCPSSLTRRGLRSMCCQAV